MIDHCKLLHIWIFYKIYKKCSRTNTTCSLQIKNMFANTNFANIWANIQTWSTIANYYIFKHSTKYFKNAHKKMLPINNKIKTYLNTPNWLTFWWTTNIHCIQKKNHQGRGVTPRQNSTSINIRARTFPVITELSK